MALIRCRADNRVAAYARSRLARVGLGAGVTVVARSAVRRGRIRALTIRRIAGSGHMALIGSRADDRVAAHARSSLAGVGLSAGVVVSAYRPVRDGRAGGALAVGRVAGSRQMALIARRADNRVRPGADTGLAGVGLSAGIVVIAGRAVGRGRVHALRSIPRVGRAGVPVVAGGVNREQTVVEIGRDVPFVGIADDDVERGLVAGRAGDQVINVDQMTRAAERRDAEHRNRGISGSGDADVREHVPVAGEVGGRHALRAQHQRVPAHDEIEGDPAVRHRPVHWHSHGRAVHPVGGVGHADGGRRPNDVHNAARRSCGDVPFVELGLREGQRRGCPRRSYGVKDHPHRVTRAPDRIGRERVDLQITGRWDIEVGLERVVEHLLVRPRRREDRRVVGNGVVHREQTGDGPDCDRNDHIPSGRNVGGGGHRDGRHRRGRHGPTQGQSQKKSHDQRSTGSHRKPP